MRMYVRLDDSDVLTDEFFVSDFRIHASDFRHANIWAVFFKNRANMTKSLQLDRPDCRPLEDLMVG